MNAKTLAAAAALSGVVAIYLATRTIPAPPAAWDVNGGAVVTTCWNADIQLPCDTGLFPASVCPDTQDQIVHVRLRAPTDVNSLPSQFQAVDPRVVGMVDSYKETPTDCPTNGKVLEVVGLADGGTACVLGDVQDASGRRIGRCCAAGCSCASQWCKQVPAVEVAGHEGVGARRLCEFVRAQPSPPAQATTWCNQNVPLLTP